MRMVFLPISRLFMFPSEPINVTLDGFKGLKREMNNKTNDYGNRQIIKVKLAKGLNIRIHSMRIANTVTSNINSTEHK